ncbi:MAG: pyridoxal phosphate-dependent aminotransferase [Bdellovibrionales bacterium]|nr:pyridoxal phosphate-dependent aminotransferase [Bdellovibrionales bacterium]
MLSQKAKNFKASPTLALAAKAKELKDQGRDIVSLTVGEPDWPTYKKACEAGIGAINSGKTKYTPAAGIPELKKEICGLTQKLLGIEYKPNQVTVSTGAKFIIFAAFQALLDNGDEVIVPNPYWASYTEMVELSGGRPKVITTQLANKFKITAKEFEAAITPQTKVFLLNSPSNPTGVEYTKEEFQALAEVLRKQPRIVVVSDDIYNQLSFSESGISPHLLHVAPDLKDRVVCINGVSKAYSMTGWRIGWATGEASIINAMASYQSQTVGAPCSISQEASVAAIRDCKEDVVSTRVQLRERFDYAFRAFSSIPGVQIVKPDSAFYLWINVSEILNKMKMSGAKELAALLIEEAGVVVVPGEDFGDKNYLRVSFAVSKADIDKAVDKIKKVVPI